MIPFQNNCDTMPVTFAWFGWLLWALAFDSLLSVSPLHLFMSPANECRKVNFPTWRYSLKFYANWLKELHLQHRGSCLHRLLCQLRWFRLLGCRNVRAFVVECFPVMSQRDLKKWLQTSWQKSCVVNLCFRAYIKLYFLIILWAFVFCRVSFWLCTFSYVF